MKKILFILLILNSEKIFSFSLSRCQSLFSLSSSSSSSKMDPYDKYKKDCEFKKKEAEKYLLENNIPRVLISIINEYICISREHWNENGKKLIEAIKKENFQVIEKLLESNEVEVDINAKNKLDIILIDASLDGHAELVRLLLANGANVNAKDIIGVTALIYASLNGHLKVVSLLLTNKADVNAKNGYASTALMEASKMGHLEIAKLLLENNADVNTKNQYEETALILATRYFHEEIIKLLLEYNADVNAKDNIGYTSLKYACLKEEIIKLLKENGATQ